MEQTPSCGSLWQEVSQKPRYAGALTRVRIEIVLGLSS